MYLDPSVSDASECSIRLTSTVDNALEGPYSGREPILRSLVQGSVVCLSTRTPYGKVRILMSTAPLPRRQLFVRPLHTVLLPLLHL